MNFSLNTQDTPAAFIGMIHIEIEHCNIILRMLQKAPKPPLVGPLYSASPFKHSTVRVW